MLRLIAYDGTKSSAVKLGFSLTYDLPGPVEDYDQDVIIRWGNSIRTYNQRGLRQDYKFCLNPRASIVANCAKHTATETLASVVGTPRLFRSFVPRGFTVVVRPFEHIAGAGFCIKEGPFPLDPGYYATQYMAVRPDTDDKECRVWFCGQHTLVGKRARSANTDPRPCRSSWGYEFNHRFSPALGEDTLKAASKMGLDAGAADVLWIGGEAYFLELNSAPSTDHWRCISFYKQFMPIAAKERFGSNARI